MHTEPALATIVPRPARLPGLAESPAAGHADAWRLRSAMLDARQLELLILNLHESLRVHSRSQFFVWTQGLLQSLIPHRVLVCALRNGEPMSFRADAFSTAVPASGVFGGLLMRDAMVMPWLVKAWKQRQFQPVECAAADASGPNGGSFVRELGRIGATRLLAHGCHDAAGQVCGLYVFAGEPDPKHSYLLQLCVPFLHAAWVRTQTVCAAEATRVAAVTTATLTVREREILRWIYLGKSNGEVGAILRISPMTVKNHVQKILRKLDVVNRAQAVGKALDAQLIGP